MHLNIKNYPTLCFSCQINKVSSFRTGILHPIQTPLGLCENLHMDFILGLPESVDQISGTLYNCIFTVVEALSKSTIFMPIH